MRICPVPWVTFSQVRADDYITTSLRTYSKIADGNVVAYAASIAGIAVGAEDLQHGSKELLGPEIRVASSVKVHRPRVPPADPCWPNTKHIE